MTFFASIFVEFIITLWHYVVYTELRQISTEILRSWVEIHLCPLVNYGCHKAAFHGSQACKTTFYKNF